MGLNKKGINFLRELRENNNRTWFQENRARAEEELLGPARELVVELGELLRIQRPQIIADPRTDRSIYRLNRDTRFSRDKTPYKTNLALWCWEGQGYKLECPGFYFHFMPEGFGWSIGCYRFSSQGLELWRAALLNPKKASAFKKAMRDLELAGLDYVAPELKRLPAGLTAQPPLSVWLRHKGFFTWNEQAGHPAELFGSGAAEFLFERFQPGFKLHRWLVDNLKP